VKGKNRNRRSEREERDRIVERIRERGERVEEIGSNQETVLKKIVKPHSVYRTVQTSREEHSSLKFVYTKQIAQKNL
jgi:hypothetical protein